MNPSASGWINKFGHIVENQKTTYPSFKDLNQDLLKHGFVYGLHLSTPEFLEVPVDVTEDEIAKINLVFALYHTFKINDRKSEFEDFTQSVFEYYKLLGIGKISFFDKILSGKKTDLQLEKLIDSRVSPKVGTLKLGLGNNLTNSLLYVDVLVYRSYLDKNEAFKEHGETLEFAVLNLIHDVLKVGDGTGINSSLVQVMESSLTFLDGPYQNSNQLQDLCEHQKLDSIERDYLLNLASLALWRDHLDSAALSKQRQVLSRQLVKSHVEIEVALQQVMNFCELHREKIIRFLEDGLASNYYDGMYKNVRRLILRNGKRLQKELSQSKELLFLITKSTKEDLNPDERKKMKSQLMDLFKTVPSLAIFLLPGGALLLPLFIKLVPKLLPSAFDDNRVDA